MSGKDASLATCRVKRCVIVDLLFASFSLSIVVILYSQGESRLWYPLRQTVSSPVEIAQL